MTQERNNTTMRDALNNIGLPQLALGMDFNNPTKKELKTIKEKVLEMDNYYDEKWVECETRIILKNYVNKWVETIRCFNLLVK